jgi:hypothetical protein
VTDDNETLQDVYDGGDIIPGGDGGDVIFQVGEGSDPPDELEMKYQQEHGEKDA